MVYHVKHMAVADAKQRVDEYFGQAATTGVANPPDPFSPVYTIADFRSNTLIVRASNKFRAEVKALLDAVDVDDSPAKRDVQVFPIRNALADDIVLVLQDIINGAFAQQRGFNQSQATTQNQQQQGQNQVGPIQSNIGAISLDLVTPDGRTPGGILFDVRISADRNSNSVIVSAPQKSMKLISESGLDVTTAEDMADGAKKIVALAGGAK